MEYVQTVTDWWDKYYPMVVTIGTSILGIIGGLTFVYLKLIKPVVDKVSELKKTVDEKSGTLSPLEIIQTNTAITDLKAKLENPTISDTLKLQYQEQLYQLENILATTGSVIDGANDKISGF